MTKTRKPTNETIAVSARWQSLFITAVIVGWLSQLAGTLLGNLTGYTSSGTWAIQITILLLPVAFFVAAFVLLSHYINPIRRLFMACLAGVIGLSFYYIINQWGLWFWTNVYTYSHPISATDASWWTAFGVDWTIMLVSLVAFAGGLYAATRKLRR